MSFFAGFEAFAICAQRFASLPDRAVKSIGRDGAVRPNRMRQFFVLRPMIIAAE
ncbi:hypothetical protein SAHL_10385 [Salinisphaera orenii YIM 95161]|uniref:Uncharacterized protein n=1 Tax=Salinisphaera orenii YIM 95161 TaxID=1051139 RepID=A0A423PRM0_9GAMM|nr:hypothetical protein SAHL_10385 [Salinisphaera halophila YIM 95161]